MRELGRVVFVVALAVSAGAHAANKASEEQVRQAGVLLDGYYGNRAILDEAVSLLSQAATAEPWSATLFIQAARATIMGGHIVSDRFEGNTIDRELALLDGATKLDPKNAKAYILRSEAYRVMGRSENALAELETAQKLNPDDPWLWNGYGDLYSRARDRLKAKASWTRAAELSGGKSEEHRKANVSAHSRLARVAAGEGDVAELQRLAAAINARRHPADAWALGDLSANFFYVARFDDSIDYARRALKVMNYGVGRRWLAAGLYAKACVENQAGRPWREYFVEARALGFDRADVVANFSTVVQPGLTQSLTATLLALPEPKR